MGAVELVSPLTPDECAARLSEATGGDGLMTFFGTFSLRPAVGRVCGRSVRIRKRGASHAGPFQAVLIGRFEEHDGGAVFRGTTNWRTINVVIMIGIGISTLLYGILSLLSFAEFLGFDMPGRMVSEGPPWEPIVGFLLVSTVGLGLARFQRRLGREEERFLVAHVADTIGSPRPWSKPATEVSQAPVRG